MGSERIVGSALLKKIVVNNKADLAINHFIKIHDLDEKWRDDTLLSGIYFLKNQTFVKILISIEKHIRMF